ncbi:hypothetical protein [Natronincola ferrireducens]|uniref:Holin n=1 Tax=Natronincola ferrireducens TaxID=393762 RepID=A0A1G9A0S6_9FIRM|nr:hypothetical protein [Natronincola ferrireducens]SDK20933.1 hypothetical protein SAMN05660472_01027 [Natronincola ferrireducens]
MPEGLELITMDVLTTFTGAVLATNIVTHFIKDYTPEFLDKKIVTLIVATFIMFSNQLFLGTISLQTLYLSFLNSFLVATAAVGNYEILTRKTKKRLIKELQDEVAFREKEE